MAVIIFKALAVLVVLTLSLIGVNAGVLRFPSKELIVSKDAEDHTTEGVPGYSSLEEVDDASTEESRTFSPSTWTPIIVLLLYITVGILIATPTIITKMIRKKNEGKLMSRKRKLTKILSLEPEFKKMESDVESHSDV